MTKEELKKSLCEVRGMLEALSSPIRQEIILILINSDKPLRIGEIKVNKCIKRPTMSHHVKILCKAKILSYNKVGTKNYYYFNPNLNKINECQNVFSYLKEVINNV